MKKFLIILFIAPAVVFAQQRVPHFPVDSLSGHIQYTLKFDFPGADKKKIYDVMIKWFSTNGGPNNPAIIEHDKDQNAIYAFLIGSCDPDFQGLTKNLPTNQFQLIMAVSDGQAVITISHFEVNRNGVMVPLENFRDEVIQKNPNGQATTFSIPGMTVAQVKEINKKLVNRDSDMLDNIDQTASAVLRDAQKYVKKAQKKQLI
jgi:hypothetical protein